MRAVPRLDMVALEVERDVAECFWVAVDVEGSYRRCRVLANLLSLGYLAEEVLGEVRRGYRGSASRSKLREPAVPFAGRRNVATSPRLGKVKGCAVAIGGGAWGAGPYRQMRGTLPRA